jgi:RHH-type rel operon transcriptional repressor/antitoxin RelB
MLAVRLPDEIENRLDRLAQTTGRSKSFYAREAIISHLDEIENRYLAAQRQIDSRQIAPENGKKKDIMSLAGFIESDIALSIEEMNSIIQEGYAEAGMKGLS